MSLELALRLTELLLAAALLQRNIEHIAAPRGDRVLFFANAMASLWLMTGLWDAFALLVLCALSLAQLHRFGGAYNGGSDKMSFLVLYCVTLAHWLPDGVGQELAFGYLGLQLILSYLISGQVKITNPLWRSGQALQEVFSYSAYPVSQNLRDLATKPRLLWTASWAVIVFEVAFPLAILHPFALYIALGIAAMFHLANAVLFGLNRFVWAWIAAYPSVIWLQDRLIG